MRVAFVNPNLAHEYDVGTPFQRPLAGSQSAQCYLAIELARRGHEVGLFNGTKARQMSHGVRCSPLGELADWGRPDAILVLNAPNFARETRQKLNSEIPIFCWEHNPWSLDPNYHTFLQSPLCSRDLILCVSEWQRDNYRAKGNVPADRIFLLRNAISPFFESLFAESGGILKAKAWPPVMAFTSTPYKGLNAATLFFRELRKMERTVTLNIFSSFELYPPNNEHRLDRSWYEFYESCRSMLGVNYVGNVSQPLLARTLRTTLALFFPSTLPETSSICIMEAMAAGCVVICSALGALPEVMAGFGHVIPLEDGKIIQGRHFIAQALTLLDSFKRNDETLAQQLQRQVAFVNANYRWALRAQELEAILQRVLTQR
ncbi:MAG: glycosyltransferase family 4 protein [Verrucomicrobia bacterium]|nr:glycosyltransferase family 4 protein [Verrucomicrobiota bacterium]